MKKRFLAAVLAALLCAGLVPSASAAFTDVTDPEVAQAVDLPILGMGGVSKGEDAAQMMLAGASAVAVGTALFADPYAPIRVRDELAALAAGQGLERAAELIGGVKPW